MKHVKYFFFLPVSIALIIVSCNKTATTSSDQSGNWVKAADFSGIGRTEAVSFVIGDTAYLGTGYDGTVRYNDLWAFSPDLNGGKGSWSQNASLPAPVSSNGFYGRSSATAFAVPSVGKAYVTTGTDSYKRFKDTWEFNPATNSWTKKADFPEPDVQQADGSLAANGRINAVGFGIGSKGYVTTGFNGSSSGTNDLYIYNPATDNWSKGASLGGEKRSEATAFVYNDEAYVLTGIKNGINVSDFWKYTPATGTWKQLRNISNTSTDSYDDDYSDIVRYNAVSFVIKNGTTSKAYLTLGRNGGYNAKTWEYDFTTDLWTRKSTYERAAREGAVAFAVKGRGFVATGTSGTYFLDDCDEWKPASTLDTND